LLNSPGIGRAHDLQRLLSYGVGIAAGLLMDLPWWRAAPVVGIAAVLFLAAADRLRGHRLTTPYGVALVDMWLTGLVVALATGSVLITAAVVGVVVAAITATFAAPQRTVKATAAVGMATALPLAAWVGNRSSAGAEEHVEALVLIVLLLAIAILILIFFLVYARQLRHRLSSQERQLQAVLDVTPVVLASVDSDGSVVNLAGNVPGWIESDAADLVPDDLRLLLSEAQDGSRVVRDVRIGSRVFRVIAEPGIDGTGLLTAYDISDQVEAQERLEDLVRSKDQFIAAVSHELRTPLTSVLGYAELVRDSTPAPDPLHGMVAEIADQSAEMAAIIDDLLVAARSSFESVPMSLRRIELHQEALAVAATVGPRLTRAPEFSLGEVEAYADPIRVRQVIRNLLTNADRYGGDQLLVCVGRNSHHALLEVRDDGPPLPQELRERIFQPYESLGPVKGQPAAIGLGLAVSRTLAELMNGRLTYDHDGNWSVFRLRLPLGPPTRAAAESGGSDGLHRPLQSPPVAADRSI
jgi:signal transduction histidine kinase